MNIKFYFQGTSSHEIIYGNKSSFTRLLLQFWWDSEDHLKLKISSNNTGSRFVESKQVLQHVTLLSFRIFTPPPTASGVITFPDHSQHLASNNAKFVTTACSIRLRDVNSTRISDSETLLHASEVGVTGLESGQPPRA